MTNSILTFVFFAAVICFSACQKDKVLCNDATNPICENYDPCIEILPANADFAILDTGFFKNCNTSYSRDVDTSFSGPLFFKAINRNSRYEWKIGLDPKVRTEQEFSLLFSNTTLGDISITLIAEVFDTNSCLLHEERRDTVTRVLNIQDAFTTAPIRGFYRGVSTEDSKDTIEIEVPPYGAFVIKNLPKDCPALSGTLSVGWGYLRYGTRDTECKEPCAFGELFDNNRQIQIDYSILENDVRVDHVFIGTKLN